MAKEITQPSEKKFPTAVFVTLIVCVTVIVVTIIWCVFAMHAIDKTQTIVDSLPKDLHTVTVNLSNN